MKILLYILLSSACLTIFYLAYKLIYIRQTNFRELRFYLLGSVIISLLVPFNQYRIELRHQKAAYDVVQEMGQPQSKSVKSIEEHAKQKTDWQIAVLTIYLIITALLLGRIILQLVVLTYNYLRSDKIRDSGCVILFNHRFRNSFSFFKWIFVTTDGNTREDLDKIIAHEKIHASQYHSFDLIMIELLAAVMWFNPLVWMMKNSMQLVHEYLADEGALNTGIDKLSYQALLINQITEEKLICLSSSFNHSLIKKRLIMMTQSKTYQKTRLKVLALIPLSVSLLLVSAILNGLFPENLLAGNDKPAQTGITASGPLSINAPGDTIRKEKVIKIITTDNQQDTVITETYTVKVKGDTAGKNVMIYRNIKEGDDTSRVVYFIDDKDIQKSGWDSPDSLVWVEVSKNDYKVDENVTVEKHIEIRKDSGNKLPDKTLIIIDGVKQADKEAFSELDPNQIERVDVITDKDQIKKYTDKAYDSVIVISSKKARK
jgi:beta-lactamase regulating signal transducer with metallopeptidase domain